MRDSSNALPDFEHFRVSDVKPAITQLIARCDAALVEATDMAMPADHQQLAEVLDGPMEALGEAWGTVMHLQSVCDSPELREAVAASQPAVTALHTRLSSDLRLYGLYKRVWAMGSAHLSAAQRKALEDSLRGFRLAGAELDAARKPRFAETQLRSAELSRAFANHLLDATEHFVYWATPEEVQGLPADVRARLEAAAQAEGRAGVYRLTLQQPCLTPVLQHAHNRALRETLYRANVTRASEFGPAERDNGPVIAETLSLRHERAAMLGLAHHAAVSLVPKMAGSTEEVLGFLRDIGRRARPQAERELGALRDFARERLGLAELQPWDLAYATEALRQDRYAFSEEEVRQHLRLDDVLAGLFEIAQALFDINIRAEALPAWHASVTAYRVERGGELLGRFYFDPFARTGKRAGAWMGGSRPRWRRPDGSLRTALAYVVTNFAAPAAGQQALLRHGDVVTLFHELGHALHFLLSEEDVLGVSGISGVEWDAVELPSQLMENFAWQWPILERITHRGLPRELFDRMQAARTFQSGLAVLRQVELALFDMRLHAEPERAGDAQAVMDEVRAEVALLPYPAFNRFQNGFAHIFAGGYAAGYYSYLWAEVLACDAWEAFEQAGVLDEANGRRYLDSILARGGSRAMRVSFEAFRGRGPKIEAFLRQRGLSSAA